MSDSDTQAPGAPNFEELIYAFVGAYVRGRVEAKRGLSWSEVKGKPDQVRALNEKKAKVAKDAFLSIRSRTGADFVAYFATTLASVPHFLKNTDFVALANALRDEPERVRTLCLLALSAHSWSASERPTQGSPS